MSVRTLDAKVDGTPRKGRKPPPVDTRWRPGQSGNPAGENRKGMTARELARQNEAAAMRTIIRAMKDPKLPMSSRLSASKIVMEYSRGKPGAAVADETGGLADFLTNLDNPADTGAAADPAQPAADAPAADDEGESDALGE